VLSAQTAHSAVVAKAGATAVDAAALVARHRPLVPASTCHAPHPHTVRRTSLFPWQPHAGLCRLLRQPCWASTAGITQTLPSRVKPETVARLSGPEQSCHAAELVALQVVGV